jgi:hypothetical protein
MSIDTAAFIDVSAADSLAARGGRSLMSLSLERREQEARLSAPSEKYATDFKAGALQERARCKAIIMSDAAKGRAALALHLATKTDLSIDAAIAMLGAAPTVAAASPAVRAHAPRLIRDPASDASYRAPGAHGAVLSPCELAARVNAETGAGHSLRDE